MKYAAIYETNKGNQIYIKNIPYLPAFSMVEKLPDGSGRYAKVISVVKMSSAQIIKITFSNAIEAKVK